MEYLFFIALLIGAVVVAGGIAIALIFGMVVVWPLSLILIILGGFVFGGAGAIVGAIISGVVGLAVGFLAN